MTKAKDIKIGDFLLKSGVTWCLVVEASLFPRHGFIYITVFDLKSKQLTSFEPWLLDRDLDSWWIHFPLNAEQKSP